MPEDEKQCGGCTDSDQLLIYGECDPWPVKSEMARILTEAGIVVSEGQYSLRLPECCGISFQCYGGDLGAPVIESKLTTAEELRKAVGMVSDVLAMRAIRHRFELYDAGENLVGYFHYDWPIVA